MFHITLKPIHLLLLNQQLKDLKFQKDFIPQHEIQCRRDDKNEKTDEHPPRLAALDEDHARSILFGLLMNDQQLR